ncbi:FMN-linked oxidoreductase [Imleria badia]|nr:FMN-linked oxidoreductase [Imleria badia]
MAGGCLWPQRCAISDSYPRPKPMSESDITHVEDAFVAAVDRCKKVGYRMRFPLRLVKRARENWTDKPLFIRISATNWAEGPEKGSDGEWKQWGIERSKVFVGELKSLGVDLVDTSSGGNWVQQKILLKHGCQVPFAAELKAAHRDIFIGAVGLLTNH